MTTAQVVKTSVTVNNNSPIQDYVHPDDQTQPIQTFHSFAKFYINELPRQYSLKEYPYTKSANVNSFTYEGGFGGKICSPDIITHKAIVLVTALVAMITVKAAVYIAVFHSHVPNCTVLLVSLSVQERSMDIYLHEILLMLCFLYHFDSFTLGYLGIEVA